MLSNIPNPNRGHIEFLKKAFEASDFYPNIECLIVHGSSLYKPFSSEFSDIDLEIILRQNTVNDYQIIKSITKSSPIPTECQLRYRDEITDPNGLILKTKYKIFRR